MSYLGALGVGWLIGAVVVSAVILLAHLSGNPEKTPVLAARRPAIWAALLALYCGGVIGAESGLERLRGTWTPSSAERLTENPPILQDLVLTASPFLAIPGIYVLAQFIGLRGRGSVRTADLAVRRLRDYLPLRLSIFTGALLLLGAASIVATHPLPAIVPDVPPLDGGGPVPQVRMAGSYFAGIAGTAYALFFLSVVGALLVIVRRRRAAALTHVEDSVIRRVHINRLLRTVAFVAVTVSHSAVSFAAIGDAAESWNTLRTGTAILGLVTIIVIIATRPPSYAEDVDQEVSDAALAPAGTTDRAVQVMLSGRRLGYSVWALCMIPLLFTVNELGGQLDLMVLATAYTAFHLTHLRAELALTRNHSRTPWLTWRNRRRLPRSILLSAVPAGVLTLLGGVMSVLVGSLPGSSRMLPFWSTAFWLTSAVALLVVVVSASRPFVRLASPAEDDALRRASVRRGLLMMSSAALAFTGFLLMQNRYALTGSTAFGLREAGTFPFQPDQVEILVLLLFVVAVAVAVVPGRRMPVRIRDGVDTLR